MSEPSSITGLDAALAEGRRFARGRQNDTWLTATRVGTLTSLFARRRGHITESAYRAPWRGVER